AVRRTGRARWPGTGVGQGWHLVSDGRGGRGGSRDLRLWQSTSRGASGSLFLWFIDKEGSDVGRRTPKALDSEEGSTALARDVCLILFQADCPRRGGIALALALASD